MPLSFTQKVKSEARRLGFDFVGITTPEVPASFPTYQSWVEDGYHGAMGYLANERALQHRSDPFLILPECQSILVLGIRHSKPAPTPPENPKSPQGRIASYAPDTSRHEPPAVRLCLPH